MKFPTDKKWNHPLGRIIQMSLSVLILLILSQSVRAADIRFSSDATQYTGAEFRVDILVDKAEDLYGLALDLAYDPETLDVVDENKALDGIQPKIEEGTLLDENGSQPTIVRAALEDDLPGNLVLGLSRSGQVQGVPVSSEALVLSAFFMPKKAGSATLTFVRRGLKDSTDADLPVENFEPMNLTILDYDWTGDVNHSTEINLEDVILCLRVLDKMDLDKIFVDADVNGDRKIGLEEAIFAAQTAAELRK